MITRKGHKYNVNILQPDLDTLKVKDIHKTTVHQFIANCTEETQIGHFLSIFEWRGFEHDCNLRDYDNFSKSTIDINMCTRTPQYPPR